MMEWWSTGVLGETAHLLPMLPQLILHHSITPPLHCSITPFLFLLHKIDIDRIGRIIYRLMLANFSIWAGLLNNRFDNPIWTA